MEPVEDSFEEIDNIMRRMAAGEAVFCRRCGTKLVYKSPGAGGNTPTVDPQRFVDRHGRAKESAGGDSVSNAPRRRLFFDD